MTDRKNPKRFYTSVDTVAGDDGWTIVLDGRPVKTPARASLTLPTEALAKVVAAEWDAQVAEIDLGAMTLTKLANVAIDRTPSSRDAMVDEIARYGETDVTCYLADGPTPLRERQNEAWAPWRGWAGREHGIVLVPVEGIVAMPQPEASLSSLRDHARASEDFRLTGLAWACSLFGSAVLALAVAEGALTASKALDVSCIDEDWQAETWGQDDEVAAARAQRAREAQALDQWFTALSQ